MNKTWLTTTAGLLLSSTAAGALLATAACTIQSEDEGPVLDPGGSLGHAGTFNWAGSGGSWPGEDPAGSGGYGFAGTPPVGGAWPGTGPAGSGGSGAVEGGTTGSGGHAVASSGAFAGSAGTDCSALLAACYEELAACYREMAAESCGDLANRCETIDQACVDRVVRCEELLVPLSAPVDTQTAAGIAEFVCAERGELVSRVELLERGVGVVCCQ